MGLIRCRDNYGKMVELPEEKFFKRPSVYAILRNGDNILVCRNRSNGKLWFPGGGVEGNETHEEALLRECEEETGIIKIKIDSLLADHRHYFYYEPEDLAMDAHLFFYECFTDEWELRSNEEIDDEEAIDFRWINPKSILKDDLSDLNDLIFKVLSDL